jgi:hypothetical protein
MSMSSVAMLLCGAEDRECARREHKRVRQLREQLPLSV